MTSRQQPSNKHRTILEFMRRFAVDRQRAPTYRDIKEGIGLSSTSVVSYHVKQLETMGYINKVPHKSRTLGLTPIALALLGETEELVSADGSRMIRVPLCGLIQAGEPLAVFDGYEADESILLDRAQLPRHNDNLFALRVRGDSMIDALIAEGDIVVLDQKSEVRNGDMVAAWLTERDELTLKYWYREGPRTRLQPANRTMEPIYVPADRVEPQGKVVFVQRQLR